MASNDEGRKRAFEEIAGASNVPYNEALIRAAQTIGATATTVNGALIEMCQTSLSSSSANINDLMSEAAESAGVSTWGEMGYAEISSVFGGGGAGPTGSGLLAETGAYLKTENSAYLILE